MLCPAQAVKDPPTLSAQDRAAAEWRYGYYYKNAVPKTLYEEPESAPDGARGFEPNTYYRLYDLDAYRLRSEYCDARLPVVARAIEQSTVLAEDKKAIFTVTRFTAERTLRRGTGVKTGGAFTVVELGGEITDAQGIRLRVGLLNGEPFAIGHSYLLFLRQAPTPHAKVYLPELERTEVIDGQLFKVGILHTRFEETALPQGESFDQFWKAMQINLAHSPCNAAPLPSPDRGEFFAALP
jgi:hypothetical protein